MVLKLKRSGLLTGKMLPVHSGCVNSTCLTLQRTPLLYFPRLVCTVHLHAKKKWGERYSLPGVRPNTSRLSNWSLQIPHWPLLSLPGWFPRGALLPPGGTASFCGSAQFLSTDLILNWGKVLFQSFSLLLILKTLLISILLILLSEGIYSLSQAFIESKPCLQALPVGFLPPLPRPL